MEGIIGVIAAVLAFGALWKAILFCFVAGFCVSAFLLVISWLIKLGDNVRAAIASIGKGEKKAIDGKAIGSYIRKTSFGVGGFATDIVKGVFDIKDDGKKAESKVAAPAVTSTVETPAPVAEVKVVTPVVTGADEL